MEVTQIFQTFAKEGLLGVLLVIVGFGYYKKDKEVGRLQKERLADVIAWKDESLKITNKVSSVIETLANLVKKDGQV